MRTRNIVAAIIFAAAVLTVGQWACVMGGDDFAMFGSYKVFAYGFPFRIVESPGLAIHTEPWPAALRILGNFTASLLVGILIAWGARRFRVGTHRSAA